MLHFKTNKRRKKHEKNDETPYLFLSFSLFLSPLISLTLSHQKFISVRASFFIIMNLLTSSIKRFSPRHPIMMTWAELVNSLCTSYRKFNN